MKHGYMWLGVLVGLGLLDAELGSPAAALNCKTAADCGGAPATCELTTHQTCAGKDPACPAGSSCGDKPTMPDQPGCAPYVEGICRRPDELPCQVDADCGAGFRCAEQISMACSGGGSSGGPGVAPTFHEECHVSRGTFRCELNDTACSVDRACGAGLTCQESDTSHCQKSKCDVDPSCEKGLRCEIRGVSYCWTSFALPARQDVAVAIDQCTMSPPTLCAPRGYFVPPPVRELSDGGVGGVLDSRPTTAEGDTHGDASAKASDGTATTDDSEQPARASGDGCSLRGRAGTAWTDPSWFALLGAVVLGRRRRAVQG